MNFKRNLIALAVGTAIVAPAAMADVTVYGLAQVELASTDPEASGADTQTNIIDNANGRVGVKASEDLGNGWTGLAKFEFKADTADNESDDTNKISLQARESMVGLKGDIGQFEAGRLKSEYKYAGGVLYDAFVATTLEARGNGGMTFKPYGGGKCANLGHGGFLPNTIGYRGGSGPVKFGLTYGPESKTTYAPDSDSSITASVKYSQDNIEAFLAYADCGDLLNSATAKGADYNATKIGGKFGMGNHTFMLQYEMTEEKPVTGKSVKPAYAFLAWNGKFGKNVFVAEYGMRDCDCTAGPSDSDVQMIVVGAIHKFTKTTRIFGGYRDTSYDSKTKLGDSTVSIGLRQDF